MTAIKYKKVAEVCEIIMGQSPSSDTYNDRKEGLPFFQGKADFGKLHPTPKTYCSAPLKVANENDILMSVRAPVGDVNIANTKCCIGRGLAAIRANNDMINYKYLFYALNYKKNEIESMGTGSTFKAISKKDIESIQIPVFDIENQVKIVKALDKAQELIDKRKAQIEALDQLTQSVFLEMFGDPLKNEKKWDVVSLKELADIIMGQSPIGESYNKDGIGVPLLNGPTEFGEKYPVEKQWTTDPKKLCQKDDILFCVRGATAGRMNFADKEYCIGRGLAAIRLKDKKDIPFVYQTLKFLYPYFQGTSNGSTFINIDKDRLEKLPILLVDDELKGKYFKLIEKINYKKELMQKSFVELQANFHSLMHRAFKGELFND